MNSKKKLLKKKTNKKGNEAIAFRTFDYRDEALVVAELSGKPELLDKFVYHFRGKDGKEVFGISAAGARELSKGRHHLKLGEPKVVENPDSWVVMIGAYDLKRNVNFWGGAEQPKKMMKYNSRGEAVFIPDQFAFAKALTKAERNAILKCTPAEQVKNACEEWYKKGKALELSDKDAPPEPQAQLSHPLKDYKMDNEAGICADCGRGDLGKRMVEISMEKVGRPLCHLCLEKELKKKEG